MFEFLKRKKKKNPLGKIGKDEFASFTPKDEQKEAETPKATVEAVKPEAVKPAVKPESVAKPKQKTKEELLIEQLQTKPTLKAYYDIVVKTFDGKNARDLVNGIDQAVDQIFAENGIKINGSESTEQKLDYARKAFDYVSSSIEYDKNLTNFLRFTSETLYHENINKEILKEIYFGLYNHAGTCLSDSCTIAYMFEKIGLDSAVIGLGDHSVVEVNIDGKKLYCDSTYEKGILNGLDQEAIAQGKGYGAGFMQDEKLLSDRNYQKNLEFPKMSLVFQANIMKEESENGTYYFSFDDTPEK